jgi:hypothetical protein
MGVSFSLSGVVRTDGVRLNRGGSLVVADLIREAIDAHS